MKNCLVAAFVTIWYTSDPFYGVEIPRRATIAPAHHMEPGAWRPSSSYYEISIYQNSNRRSFCTNYGLSKFNSGSFLPSP